MILRRKITLDKSLLASLRIMAIFISIDGELHDKQVKWFTWLIKSRVVNPEHQKLLLEDLKNPPKIQDLFSDVMDSDRERLLGWARIAVNIDGKLDEEEKALYSHLKELIERDNLLKGDSHRVIAQAIIEYLKTSRSDLDLVNVLSRNFNRLPFSNKIFSLAP